MNEILNGHGLRGDGNFDWSGLIKSLLDVGGEVATTAINAKNGTNTNTNTNASTNGGGTVTVVQQDKTLLYIGVGALALMAIFMITNSGRRK